MPVAEATRSARASAVFGALSALAFALSFPLSESFVAGWPLAFVWPALFAAAVWRAPRPSSLGWTIGVPFFAAFLAHEWWMRHITELGMPVLVLYLTAWTVLCALVLRGLSVGRGGRARWPFALSVPVALVAIEYLRGSLICSGYAWFFTAHPLVEWTSVAQIASLGGGWMLTALAGLVGGAAVDSQIGATRVRWIAPSVAALLVCAAAVFGSTRTAAIDSASESAPRARLLVVQTNLPMSNKLAWPPEQQIEDFLVFARQTIDGAKAAREQGGAIDLALWPETMLPGLGLEPESLRALVAGPGDHDRIDKILLTPFGETMPYISNWKWLERQLLDLGARGMQFNLNAGERGRLLTVRGADGPVRIGVPICFEDTVSRAVQSIVAAGDGAQVLVNLSNDGWFGAYLPGRAQHEQAARWRTIEHRVPMVRVANTGVTAAFDQAGRRIGGPLAAGTEGVLRVELPVGSRGGVFTRTGDVASWTMFLGSVVMMVRARRPRLDGAAVRAASWTLLATMLCACGGAKDGRVESWSSKQQSVTEDSTVALSKGPRVRPQLPVSASADPARNARQLLDEASRSVDPMIRAIAIEAMEHDPTVLEPAVRRGLGDPNPGVRFCAAVVGSKAGLAGLAPLVEPLLLDASPSVQAGAILALHRCGRPVDPTPLAVMVVSPSPEIRGNAVMVLGDLGNRTAMPLLKQGFETPMPRAMPAAVRVVDLQIAEAMVKLGDMSQLEPIHAALFSRSDQGECIALACQIVGTLRDKSSLPMLQRLIDAGGDDTRPLEIRLVAAIACMKILSPGPEALAELGLLGSQDKRPEVRALAARLLGWFQTPQAAAALSQLLRDRDPSVQISAAASLILQDASARGREPAQR